jgi:hypothetical protein
MTAVRWVTASFCPERSRPSGYNVQINVADGNYANIYLNKINGAGQVFLIGDQSTPANCKITGTNRSAIGTATGCGQYTISGFELSCSGSSPGEGICNVNAYGAGTVIILGNINFNSCVGSHISTQQGSLISNYVPGSQWVIKGGASGNQYENGSFVFAYANGQLINNSGGGPNLTVANPVTLAGDFILSAFSSFVQLVFMSITGAGNVTGQKYNVNTNANISTGGAGVNYYPGTVAGVYATGGNYT